MRLRLPKRVVCVNQHSLNFNGCTGSMSTYSKSKYEQPERAGPWSNSPGEIVNEKTPEDLLSFPARKEGIPYGYFIHENISQAGFLTELERQAKEMRRLNAWWLLVGGKKRGMVCAGNGALGFKGKAIPKFIVDPHISAGFEHLFDSGYLQYREDLDKEPVYEEPVRKKSRDITVRVNHSKAWLTHLILNDVTQYYDYNTPYPDGGAATSSVWSTERKCLFNNVGLPWWEEQRRLGYEDYDSEQLMKVLRSYNYSHNNLYYIAGSGLMRGAADSMRVVTTLYERAGYEDPCTSNQWSFKAVNGKTVYYKVLPFLGRSSHGSQHPMFGAVLCTKPLKFRKIKTTVRYADDSKVASG
jgi:hypothetical protein